MDKIIHLLHQISIIQKKYDDLAEFSGEHYNVFDILGVRSDELSHSSILTNLLNANGRHGQKDLFLELFIRTIKKSFKDDQFKVIFLKNFSDFNTKNSTAEKEKFTGKVNYEAEQGGIIDIIISDGNKNIIIENKIYAGDQPKQLARYNEFDKNAPILYLTLNGKDASPDSTLKLQNGIHYICISYQNEITFWLAQCIKEMANKPIIRETLNQYLFLIKSLTNQSNNNKMSDEIIDIVLKDESNFEAFKEIYNVKNKIFPFIFKEKLFPLIEVISKSHNFDSEIDKEAFLNMNGKWLGFSFTNDHLKNNNIKIAFSFNVSNGFREMIYGFNYINHDLKSNYNYTSLKDNFNKTIKNTKETGGWPCFTYFDEYRNWEDITTMQKILFSDFEKTFIEKIDLMLEVSTNSFSN